MSWWYNRTSASIAANVSLGIGQGINSTVEARARARKRASAHNRYCGVESEKEKKTNSNFIQIRGHCYCYWLVGCGLAFTKGESIERKEYGNNEFNAVGIVFVFYFFFSASSKQAIHHSKIKIYEKKEEIKSSRWKLSDVLLTRGHKIDDKCRYTPKSSLRRTMDEANVFRTKQAAIVASISHSNGVRMTSVKRTHSHTYVSHERTGSANAHSSSREEREIIN